MSDHADGRFTIALAKEDFKFSCAHFTLFGTEEAELLHGHNYQVRLEVEGTSLDELGILIDFGRAKSAVRTLCAELDSRTLIPIDSPLLAIAATGDGVDASVEVRYDTRRYVFPREDVLLLPLVNTTVELLARWLWQRLAEILTDPPLVALAVEVSETAGQSCRFRAALSSS